MLMLHPALCHVSAMQVVLPNWCALRSAKLVRFAQCCNALLAAERAVRGHWPATALCAL